MIKVQRRSGWLSWGVLAASLSGTVGCGGGDSSGDTGGQTVAIEQLPAQFSKVLCDKIYMCCSASERMGNPFVGTDVASCQPFVGGLLTLVVPAIQQSVAKGRSVYHADRMGACLAKIRAAACSEAKMDSISIAACENALEPKVAIGGDCGDHGDCVGGWCNGAENMTLGKCVATKADGQPCLEDEECTSRSCNADGCGPRSPGSNALCM